MNVITTKFKEVVFSVLPITILVLLLNFTLTPIDTPLVIRFIIGAFFIVIGLTVFLIGVDISITRIGNILGSAVVRTNKLWIVAVAGLVLGFIISVAEPDLQILAGQVDSVTQGLISKLSIVVFVSLGIALMLMLGLIRIVNNFPLYILLTVIYGIILIMSFFVTPEFLAISFDASGATTGALTVPFILALAIGVSKMKKDSKSSEKDSFGLVSIASTGAIIAVMIMNIAADTGTISGEHIKDSPSASIIEPFIHELPKIAFEITVALLPVLIIFLLLHFISLKLPVKTVRRILFGILFTFLGLVIFLTGVNAGFMDVGSAVGYSLASLDNKAYLVGVGFILGFVTILAEPAVYVLTRQIEDVTSGYVSRKAVMITLSIGVGLAVALSMLRILIPELKLWHYLLPGYIISVALMYIVPKLFVGIAFDSGGVASGPMTATFILAYASGAAEAIESADVLVDGFGMIAMVAMTPIIALQVLGFIFKLKSKKRRIEKNG
ncbi:MAG: DUF1538 domain-containing protein [Eubacteriales bacterium]